MNDKALEMAKEFKRYQGLEKENGENGNLEQAKYYMNKKWEIQAAAESLGIIKEFGDALKYLDGE